MDGETYLKRRLTDPPRAIPFLLAVQLLFGGAIGFMGWFFLGFGMIFLWIFAMNSDPAAMWVFRGELASAPGTVIATQRTNFSEGGSEGGDGTPIYAHRYQFTISSSMGSWHRAGSRPRNRPTRRLTIKGCIS